MDDERRAAVREKRVRTVAHVDPHIRHGRVRGALAANHKVGHVARVRTLGILQSVLFRIGVEMVTSRLESRTFTLRDLMKVNAVRARRQICESQLDSHSLARLGQCGCAD
jgi:hypothetical protein